MRVRAPVKKFIDNILERGRGAAAAYDLQDGVVGRARNLEEASWGRESGGEEDMALWRRLGTIYGTPKISPLDTAMCRRL